MEESLSLLYYKEFYWIFWRNLRKKHGCWYHIHWSKNFLMSRLNNNFLRFRILKEFTSLLMLCIYVVMLFSQLRSDFVVCIIVTLTRLAIKTVP
jgi:hypothetical protein